MKPFAICSDNHYHQWSAFSTINSDGVNSRLQHIIDETKRMADDLESRGGNVLYFGGDTYHVRGSVDPKVLNPVADLFEELIERGFECRMIAGNHDLSDDHSNKLGNASQVLEKLGCKVNVTPTYYPDHKLVMLPWHPEVSEVDKKLKHLGKKEEMDYAIIHAPMNSVIKGIPDTGLDPDKLKDYGFKKIWVGHYHSHRNFHDKVYSIGAMTHQTWGDVGSKAGYIIVDNDEVTHVSSSAPMFVDYDKDDDCEGNYVRVNLEEATPEEIAKIKQHVMDQGALGCIVKATPKKSGGVRAFTVKSGTSTIQSVNDFIDSQSKDLSSDISTLKNECLEILREAETAEE